jgi:hypothetical protein
MSFTTGERTVNTDLLMKSSSYKPTGPCPHVYHYACKVAQFDRQQYNGESVENFWPQRQTEGERVDGKEASRLKNEGDPKRAI